MAASCSEITLSMASTPAVIVLMTFPISDDYSPSLFIVVDVRPARPTASDATWAASAAFCEISRIDAPICSLPADTVSTLREISSAAADTACACSDVRIADCAICRDAPLICSVAPASDVADASIVDTVSRSRNMAAV